LAGVAALAVELEGASRFPASVRPSARTQCPAGGATGTSLPDSGIAQTSN